MIDQRLSRAVGGWLAEIDAEGVQTDYPASNEFGRARGVNRGIERVATRFLAITDDDCEVHRGWRWRVSDGSRRCNGVPVA